jgi:hypothetical protein
VLSVLYRRGCTVKVVASSVTVMSTWVSQEAEVQMSGIYEYSYVGVRASLTIYGRSYV